MRQTVVGVFDRQAAAQQAAATLRTRGIDPDCIHVTQTPGGTADGSVTSASTSSGQHEERGVMDSVRHFFADLFGDDDDDVKGYAQAVQRGGAVVKVDVDADDQVELARQALEDAGAVDIDEQDTETWSTAGSSASVVDADGDGDLDAGTRSQRVQASMATDAGSTASASTTGRASTGEQDVIPVVREDLAVGKRTVRAGGVRVYARTVSEQVSETVQLREERAVVDRRPVDRAVTGADLDALTERTIEVTESVERPVVEKTARVVEEVRVGKEVRHTEAKIDDTLRHTEVEVEQIPGDLEREEQRGAGSGAMADDSAFRSHFTQQYASSGGRYEDYEPAYRFGSSLRADSRYSGRQWSEIEPEVQRDWSTTHPDSPWERFKDAARHAWDRVTD